MGGAAVAGVVEVAAEGAAEGAGLADATALAVGAPRNARMGGGIG